MKPALLILSAALLLASAPRDLLAAGEDSMQQSADEARELIARLDAMPIRRDVSRPSLRQLSDIARVLNDADRRVSEIDVDAVGEPMRFSTEVFRHLAEEAATSISQNDLNNLRASAIGVLESLRVSLNDCQVPAANWPARRQRLEESRPQLDEILSAPEFRVSRDYMGDMLHWVSGYIERFYAWMGITQTQAGTVSRTIMQIVLVTVVAALVFIVGRGIVRHVRDRAETAPARRHRIERAVRLDSPDGHAASAARAFAEGRLRDAVHHWYLMGLSALERARLVMLDRTRTNWEYQRQLEGASRDQAADLFAQMNRFYDRKWYGHEDLSAADASTFESLARRLLTEVTDETH